MCVCMCVCVFIALGIYMYCTFSCTCSPTVLAQVALYSLTRIRKVTLRFSSCVPSTGIAVWTYIILFYYFELHVMYRYSYLLRATVMTSLNLHFRMANSNSIAHSVGLPSQTSMAHICTWVLLAMWKWTLHEILYWFLWVMTSCAGAWSIDLTTFFIIQGTIQKGVLYQ